MIKLSKNIEPPKELFIWLRENEEALIRLIKESYFASKGGCFNPINFFDKLKLTKPYDSDIADVTVTIASRENFAANGWDDKYYGYAQTGRNRIWLNSSELYRFVRSKDMFHKVRDTIIHEAIHIIDPKLYREDIGQRDDLPYYNRPYEFDAYSASFSNRIREKMSSHDILEMLRDSNLWDRKKSNHKALKEWTPEQMRTFKLRLYQDVVNDMNSKEGEE